MGGAAAAASIRHGHVCVLKYRGGAELLVIAAAIRAAPANQMHADGVEQSKDVNSRCPSHVALGARVDDIIDNLTEIMSSLRLCPKQSRQFASYTPLHDRRGMIYIRFSVCESFSRDAPPRTRPGRLHGRWRLGRY